MSKRVSLALAWVVGETGEEQVALSAAALPAELLGGAPLTELPLIRHRVVLMTAAERVTVTPDEALALVVSHLAHLVEKGDFTATSVLKAGKIQARFVAYTRTCFDITDVRALDRSAVLAFVNAPMLGAELRPPAERTKDNRRWALALLFRSLRTLGLYDSDPLLDITPFERQKNSARPLADWELVRCERFARSFRGDTLGPARLALAETTATASEIAQVVVGDIDSDVAHVWLAGCRGSGTARWGHFTEWGQRVIQARLAELHDSGTDAFVVYQGNGRNAPSAVGMGLMNVIRAAQLVDPRVYPKSIRAWAGRRIWDETQDLEEVRNRVGLQSLDSTRDLIEVPFGRCDIPPAHRRPQ